jgi:hypothetical protein
MTASAGSYYTSYVWGQVSSCCYPNWVNVTNNTMGYTVTLVFGSNGNGCSGVTSPQSFPASLTWASSTSSIMGGMMYNTHLFTLGFDYAAQQNNTWQVGVNTTNTGAWVG